MSGGWWHTAAGAASLMGLVLGVILGAVTWLQHRDTKKILTEMEHSTKALLERMETAAEAGEGGTDAP
jgi:hypothetical protein